MGIENTNNEQVKASPPLDLSKPDTNPNHLKEGGEKLREKLEGAVSGPCKNESMKNMDGQDEKNLIGFTEEQRTALGVNIKDYVNVTNDKTGETKRYMVVRGLKENVGTSNFTVNGIEKDAKVTVQK